MGLHVKSQSYLVSGDQVFQNGHTWERSRDKNMDEKQKLKKLEKALKIMHVLQRLWVFLGAWEFRQIKSEMCSDCLKFWWRICTTRAHGSNRSIPTFHTLHAPAHFPVLSFLHHHHLWSPACHTKYCSGFYLWLRDSYACPVSLYHGQREIICTSCGTNKTLNAV